MHTKVVFRAAKAALKERAPALRFNFRGVGQSQGRFAEGVGETDDVRAALDFLSSRYPQLPIILMGFSFGSRVGLVVGASDARVSALVGMGLPVESYSYSYLDDCPKPKLIIEGTQDVYGPRRKVEEAYAAMASPKSLHWVQGADHFFTGQLEEVQTTIQDFIRDLTRQS
ncbi:MAG: alpha/beta hydrolase [Terriglobia bacterium]